MMLLSSPGMVAWVGSAWAPFGGRGRDGRVGMGLIGTQELAWNSDPVSSMNSAFSWIRVLVAVEIWT